MFLKYNEAIKFYFPLLLLAERFSIVPFHVGGKDTLIGLPSFPLFLFYVS